MSDTDFDLASVDALDEGKLAIRHPKTQKPTTWVWTFYGPAHPETVAIADKASREALRKAAEQRQARANGLPVDDDERTLESIRTENVDSIVARTKSFTPVSINGEVVEFSQAKARELLLDRRKGWLMAQVMTYLGSEANFIQPSAVG